MDKQQRRLQAKARAVYQKEMMLAEQTQNKRNDLTLDERVSLDSQSRVHKKVPPPGVFKMSRDMEGYSENYPSEEDDNNGNNGSTVTWQREMNATRQREDDGNPNQRDEELNKLPYPDDILEFKLSQKTFKKTVLQKQEEYREKIRSHLAEKKKNLVDFCRTGGARTMIDGSEVKKDNKDGTVNMNHFTVNKGYFVNRDM